MKGIYLILIAVLVTFMGAVIAISLAYALPRAENSAEAASTKASYHYAMIDQVSDEEFTAKVHKGALDAATELGVAVEMSNVRPSRMYSVDELFDMALDARVDGIAIQVSNSESVLPSFEKAKDLGIPVVIFETDSFSLKNITTIGTNGFQAGYEAGKLAIKCSQGEADIAVILNRFSSSDETVSKNLKISGMVDAFKDYPNMKISVVQRTDGGVFGAEKVAKDILRDNPNVNMIVAFNEMDTLGIIDVIVDANKVGTVDIIGYGALPEIMKYVKRGVVYGTVASDPYRIGYECIKALADISKSGYTSAYFDTGVFTYTKDNIEETDEPK